MMYCLLGIKMKHKTESQIRDEKIRNLEFTIERLIERIEKLERTKADKK